MSNEHFPFGPYFLRTLFFGHGGGGGDTLFFGPELFYKAVQKSFFDDYWSKALKRALCGHRPKDSHPQDGGWEKGLLASPCPQTFKFSHLGTGEGLQEPSRWE